MLKGYLRGLERWLSEDLSQIPSSHSGHFTDACDPSSEGRVSVGTCMAMVHTDTDSQIFTKYLIKKGAHNQ